MSSYISRHRPRQQTAIAGKVASLNTYDRFYDIVMDGLQHRNWKWWTCTLGIFFFALQGASTSISHPTPAWFLRRSSVRRNSRIVSAAGAWTVRRVRARWTIDDI